MIIKRDFIDAVVTANRFTSRRQTIPILRNVKVEVADGMATVTGTNQTDAAILSVPVETQEVISFTIDGNRVCEILEVLASVDSEDVSMNLVGNDKLELSSKGVQYSLPTIPTDEYPMLRWVGKKITTIPSSDIIEGINACLPKVDGIKGTVKNSVCIMLSQEKGLRFVATDGKVGIEMQYPTDYSGEPLEIILPADSARLLVNVARKDKEVCLETTEGQEGFYGVRASNGIYLFRRMEGKYIEWDANVGRMKELFDNNGFTISRQLIADLLCRINPIIHGLDHQGVVLEGKDGSINVSICKTVGSYSEDITVDGAFDGKVILNHPVLDSFIKGLCEDAVFGVQLNSSPTAKKGVIVPSVFTSQLNDRTKMWGFIAPMIDKE